MLGPEQKSRVVYVHHVRNPTYTGLWTAPVCLKQSNDFLSLIQAGGRSASGHQQSTLFAPTAPFHMCVQAAGCKQRTRCLPLLLLALLPGASGMEGSPEKPGMSGDVPVAVAALMSVAVGGDGFPPCFDLRAWAEEKGAWEVEWCRLVDWVGDQEEACLQLIGLEARLRAMYEWLLKTEDVSAKHREVCKAVS